MPAYKLTYQGQDFQVDAPDEATALEAFNQTMSAPKVSAAPQQQGSVPAGIRGAVDTMTFGMSDEIAAGLSTITGMHGKFGDYDANLKRQREVQQFDEQNNPVARTVGQVAGGVGSGLGMARAGLLATPKMAGAAFAPRAAVAAGEGATLAAGYGLGSGEGAEGRIEEAAKAMGPGAVFGVGGEYVAPFVSRAGGYVADKVQSLVGAVDPAGSIARAQQELASILGVNPADIPDAVATEFAKRASTAVDPSHAARTASAGEFGIPLTRGQATGETGDLAFEEAARHQARGELAGQSVRGLDEKAREAIDRSKLTIAEGMAPTRGVISTSQNELAQEVLEGVRGAERRAWQGVDQAYDAARESGVALKSSAIESAAPTIKASLDAKGFIINEATTPYAAAALRAIDDMKQLRGALDNKTGGAAPLVAAGDDVGVSLAGIEAVRSKILKYRANAKPDEKGAVDAVRRSFDEWVDSTADDQLLAGTKDGIELFKAARASRRQYAAKFESNPRQGDDDAGRILEKFVEKDVTPGEVANYLIGSAKAGERGVSVRLAARLKGILGDDSPEWGALKQATWFKLVNGDNGDAAALGAQAISQRVLKFASGQAEPFAKVLYSPAEIAQMRRFAVAVGQTVTPKNVRNDSGSGYEVARAAGDVAKSFSAVVGTAVGGPKVGIALRILSGLVADGKNALQGRRAAQGAPSLRYGTAARGATSGATYGYTSSGNDPALPAAVKMVR